MSAVVVLVVIALVSLLVTRVATIALTVTGLPRQSARFQARSALSGVGFTTSESEQVVNHPARRRIVMALMLIGNVGLVTAVASLLGGFLGAGERTPLRAALLIGGLWGVYALARSPWVDRHLSRVIRRNLDRYTSLDVRDYGSLLHLYGDYAIHELLVEEGDWLADRTLADLRVKDEGLLVIGVVHPQGSYVGVPGPETRLHPGDTLIVYGRGAAFEALSTRRQGWKGDREHRAMVARQQRQASKEQHQEQAEQAQTQQAPAPRLGEDQAP